MGSCARAAGILDFCAGLMTWGQAGNHDSCAGSYARGAESLGFYVVSHGSGELDTMIFVWVLLPEELKALIFTRNPMA